MYLYLNDRDIGEYLEYCGELYTKLADLLEERHKIRSTVTQTFRRAGDMMLFNNDGFVCLEHDLVITELPPAFLDPEALMSTVLDVLNEVMEEDLFDKNYDPSVLSSSRIFFDDVPSVIFEMHLSVLKAGNDGRLSRLIYNVWYKNLYWCEIPSTAGLDHKLRRIIEYKKLHKVREVYLERQNQSLCHNERDRLAIALFADAVDQVYGLL